MKNSIKLDRRDFIKGLGAAGILSSTQVNRALAATTVAPIRVLFVALQHGWGTTNRPMIRTADGFSFPSGLDPLNSIRDKCTVVDGVRSLGDWGNNHDLSYGDMLTAGVPFGMEKSSFDSHMPLAVNASLDYLLEEKSGLPAFRFTAGYASWGVQYHPLSLDHNTNVLPFHTSANNAYNSLFKNSAAGSSSTGSGSADPDALAITRALNFVQSPTEQKIDALPHSEKEKLHRYLLAMKHLESKNQVSSSFSGSESLKEVPTKGQSKFKDLEHYLDMVKVGFANNMTNSAVIGIGDIHMISDFHHTHAHACSDVWWNTRREHAQYIVNMANAMDAIVDFDGSSLLDNTMIVLTGEVGDGRHNVLHKGHIIIGGASVLGGSRLIQPTVLNGTETSVAKREDVNGNLQSQLAWSRSCSSRTNADILREIGNFAGLNLQEFGLPSQNTGDILM